MSIPGTRDFHHGLLGRDLSANRKHTGTKKEPGVRRCWRKHVAADPDLKQRTYVTGAHQVHKNGAGQSPGAR